MTDVTNYYAIVSSAYYISVKTLYFTLNFDTPFSLKVAQLHCSTTI